VFSYHIRIFALLTIFTCNLISESNEFFLEQKNRLLDSDPKIVRDAIDRLAFVQSSRGVRDILSALEGDPNFPDSPLNSPAIKFYAAQALGKKGESIVIAPMIEVYKRDCKNITERTIAKRKLTDPVSDSKNTKSPYFYGEGDHNIVLACGEMLRALGGLPFREDSYAILKSALEFPNFYIRSSAADGLYSTEKKESISILTNQLGKESDPYAKVMILSAILGLERLPNANFRQVLEFLQSKDPEIRKKSSMALSRLRLGIAAPYLKKAIDVENVPDVLLQMQEDYSRITAFQPPG